MSEITDRLDALEKRVAQLKDWKQKYEQEKKKWTSEKKDLEELVAGARKLAEVLWGILAPYFKPAEAAVPRQAGSLNVNLEENQLTVNVTHQEKDVNMTTATVLGKVLFCALTELPKEGFSEAELAGELKEHGWNIGHSTLAPTLGGCIRDGYLVKADDSRPAKYRLPVKLKMNVEKA